MAAFFAVLDSCPPSPTFPPSLAWVLVGGLQTAWLMCHLDPMWSSLALRLWLGTESLLAQGCLADQLGGPIGFMGTEDHIDTIWRLMVKQGSPSTEHPTLLRVTLLTRLGVCGRCLFSTWGLLTYPASPPMLLAEGDLSQGDETHPFVLGHPISGLELRVPQMMLTLCRSIWLKHTRDHFNWSSLFSLFILQKRSFESM